MTDAPLMLSVSGARGIVGQTMTPQVARNYANAFASYLHDKLGRLPKMVVARDSRPSGPSLQSAVADAFVACGCVVEDIGVVATPTAGVMIGALGADGGIIVTASHNPTPWNGLKCLNGQGLAPSKEDTEEIIQKFHDAVSLPSTEGGALQENTKGNDTHLAKVLGVIDPTPIQEKQFRVVLDSINGAGCESGYKLLTLLGCEILQINGEPSGEFAHEPEPKIENLGDLCDAVIRFDADVGFAQDPDADRLAVVDEFGGYIGEEYTLALVAKRWFELNPSSSATTNLSTSRMIDDIANEHGCKVYRSAVGEANVATTMQQQGCTIGGEGNGGIILPDVCWVRDSLSGMALILDLLRSREERLSDIGLRIDFDEGWLHVRPSNTEPIARVIAEAKDSLTAYKLANRVKLPVTTP